MGFGGASDNKSYADDQVVIADIINTSGVQGSLTVGTSAIEVKVGSSPLTGRKSVTLFNNSNNTIYWGWNDSVTISTGTPIFKNQMFTWTVGDSITIFVIAGVSGNNVRITEAS